MKRPKGPLLRFCRVLHKTVCMPGFEVSNTYLWSTNFLNRTK